MDRVINSIKPLVKKANELEMACNYVKYVEIQTVDKK